MRANFFLLASALSSSSTALTRRILLARHGETNFNAQGRIQGTLDSSFLNLNGVTQAGELGKYLSRAEPETIGRVWVSPMTRARQTLSIAKAVMEGAGCVVPEGTVHDDLKEIELFEWQGRLKDEIAASEPEVWKAWKADPVGFRMPNDRAPLQELWARACSSWDVILAEKDVSGTTLVVCHGALGRCLIGAALGMDVSMFRDSAFVLENCALVEIVFEDGVGVKWRRVLPEPTEFSRPLA
mmetsp:Transcript_9891/g.19734  ORF Transcript_9891/g.19734 Transcript_9891/m.19734 type:complete len:241 (-) Transcript_9891:113-835(-)